MTNHLVYVGAFLGYLALGAPGALKVSMRYARLIPSFRLRLGVGLLAAGVVAGPFADLFKLDSNKAEKAVNWGIAALVWLALGRLVALLLLRQ